MDVVEVAIRLGSAAAAGCALGLNRDLHGKPTGVRTLGLVGLGSAIAVLLVADQDINAVSRVVQGLLTGIGFLCAGAIVHGHVSGHVHGLTTAACAWLTACLGAACGMGYWTVVLVSLPFIFAILLLGGPLERLLRRIVGEAKDE